MDDANRTAGKSCRSFSESLDCLGCPECADIRSCIGLVERIMVEDRNADLRGICYNAPALLAVLDAVLDGQDDAPDLEACAMASDRCDNICGPVDCKGACHDLRMHFEGNR